MKKRLVSAAVTVALFIGLIAGVTFQSSDKKEIKHFTAFFSVEGDNIDPDNDIKQLIAEQIGAECEEKVTDTDRKKSYRKSTIHQSEPKNKGLSRFKQNLKESNTSIKTKNTNLHIAGRTGALVAGAVTDQVEGGQEVSQAAYLAYEASRPVTGTASKGAALFRKKAAAEAKKRIKKVEAGKKLAKKTAKKAAKDTAKTVAKETASQSSTAV